MSKEKKGLLELLRGFVSDSNNTELAEETTVTLAQETLENGVILEAETFESGQPVFIVSEVEDEPNVPLPVGEYMMSDNRVLVVTEDGIIGEITEVAQDTPETAAEEVQAAAETVSLEEFNSLKETIGELKATLDAIKADSETKLAAVEAEKVELQAQLADKPDAKKVKTTPVELAAVKPATASERIMAKLAKHRD